MDTKQTKQLVMQAYQNYKDGNIKGVLALIDDKVEWIGPESDYIPFAGTHKGIDQVAQFFSTLEEHEETLKFEPQTFIAEGDKVAVTGEGAWRVKATGQTYDTHWAHIFTIRGGKIARFEQHIDTAAAEAAFRPAQGAAPTKGKPMRH